jgi:superfamily II helicase
MTSIEKQKQKQNQHPSPAAINRSHTQGRPEDERNGGNRQRHTINTRKNTKQNRNPYSTQSKGTQTFTPPTKTPPSLQKDKTIIWEETKEERKKSTCRSRSNTEKKKHCEGKGRKPPELSRLRLEMATPKTVGQKKKTVSKKNRDAP